MTTAYSGYGIPTPNFTDLNRTTHRIRYKHNINGILFFVSFNVCLILSFCVTQLCFDAFYLKLLKFFLVFLSQHCQMSVYVSDSASRYLVVFLSFLFSFLFVYSFVLYVSFICFCLCFVYHKTDKDSEIHARCNQSLQLINFAETFITFSDISNDKR